MRNGVLIFLALCFQNLSGQFLVKLPFGREWGEAPAEMLQWAGKVDLDVFVELPAKRPEVQIFTFKQTGGGIPNHPAHSIEARFFRDRLYELTVNFEYEDETPKEVRKRFYDVKRDLEKKMGEFRLNGRSQSVDDNFLTREESFHFEPSPKVFLLMAYSSVEDRLRKKGEGRYSVIYHNGTLGEQSPKEAVPTQPGVLPDKE